MKLTVVFCMVAALASAASAEVAYSTVESGMGYSSWPMIQSLGDRLVCVYIRGTAHSIVQGVRDAYAKWSADGGRTWSQPVAVSASPEYGETSIGKGLDKDGAALFWVRAYGGSKPHHELYRNPLAWPESEVVARGSDAPWDAGNANATSLGDTHYIAFYSGVEGDTSVVVAAVPTKVAKGEKR